VSEHAGPLRLSLHDGCRAAEKRHGADVRRGRPVLRRSHGLMQATQRGGISGHLVAHGVGPPAGRLDPLALLWRQPAVHAVHAVLAGLGPLLTLPPHVTAYISQPGFVPRLEQGRRLRVCTESPSQGLPCVCTESPSRDRGSMSASIAAHPRHPAADSWHLQAGAGLGADRPSIRL
jgi:hypothetical protein